MKTINQLIDALTIKVQKGDRKAKQKLNRLVNYKIKHPYSGKLKVNNEKAFL